MMRAQNRFARIYPGATVLGAIPGESSAEFYVFPRTAKLPDEWIAMGLKCQNGILPSGEWVVKKAAELGYDVLDPSGGTLGAVADDNLWNPSLTTALYLFNARALHPTPQDAQQKLFAELTDVKQQYVVAAEFATSDGLQGMQDTLEGLFSMQGLEGSAGEIAEVVKKEVSNLGGSLKNLTSDEPSIFVTWGKRILIGALVAGGLYVGIKYGVPAWKRRKGQRSGRG